MQVYKNIVYSPRNMRLEDDGEGGNGSRDAVQLELRWLTLGQVEHVTS